MTFLIAVLFATSIFAMVTSFRDILTPPVTLRERMERMIHNSGGPQVLTLDDETQQKSLQQKIELRLEGSGVKIELKELVMMASVAAFVALVSVWGATGSFAIGALGAVAAFLALPYFVVERRRQARLQQIDDQLAESLSMMSSALKSGLSVPQTFRMLEEETNEPIKSEFARITNDLALGENMSVSLNNFAERIPSEDVRMFVSAVLISRQTGGDLSIVLENISSTIRARVALKRDIQAKTAMARMSATILSLAPGVMFLILSMVNPNYVSKLTGDPMGQLVLIVSVVFNIIGALLVRRVSQIEGLEPKRK